MAVPVRRKLLVPGNPKNHTGWNTTAARPATQYRLKCRI
jgi:hypothetical protein